MFDQFVGLALKGLSFGASYSVELALHGQVERSNRPHGVAERKLGDFFMSPQQ